MVSGVSGGMPSMQELQQMQQRMFKKADADGSGGLDKTEFANMIADGPGGKAPGGTDASDAFTKIDANGDGQLTTAELDKGMQDMMANFQSTASVFGGASSNGGQSLDAMLSAIGSASQDSTGSTSSTATSKTSTLVEQLQKLLAQLSASITSGQSSGSSLSVTT
jgi:hypothetical protein